MRKPAVAAVIASLAIGTIVASASATHSVPTLLLSTRVP
jgi:hypothetical protein